MSRFQDMREYMGKSKDWYFWSKENWWATERRVMDFGEVNVCRIDASACGFCKTKTSANAIYHCVRTNSGIFRGSLEAIYIPAVGQDRYPGDLTGVGPRYFHVTIRKYHYWSGETFLFLPRPTIGAIYCRSLAQRSWYEAVIYVRVSQPRSLSLLSRQWQHTLIETFPLAISWLTSTQSIKLYMWKCTLD